MSSLGDRLISDAENIIMGDIIDVSRIPVIRDAMNAVYRHFKEEITNFNSRDPNLIKIFKLERLMKNVFLPLDSEPLFDSEEELDFPTKIESEDDFHKTLRFIVHETRDRLSRWCDLSEATLEGECLNTGGIVSDICSKMHVREKRFALNQNLSPGTFHCFNIVTFNVDDEVKSYLIDCTYRQFFTYSEIFFERIGLPLNNGPSIGAYMMMDENRIKIAEELLKNGYIEFTPENAKVYFDSFVFSGRNGKYYEQLGKEQLEKGDYEPDYTFEEYITAINNKGLKEDQIKRQKEVLINKKIEFDSDSVMPYLSEANGKKESETKVIK